MRSHQSLLLATTLAACAPDLTPQAVDEEKLARSPRGIVAEYNFTEANGTRVRDRSGYGTPLDLVIRQPRTTAWLPEGGLHIQAPTIISSSGPAQKVTDACLRTGAVTIEAWVQPADTTQGGPARIVTISQNPGRRNISLNQDGNLYQLRLTALANRPNGLPFVRTEPGSVIAGSRTHLAVTYSPDGTRRFYVNGSLSAELKQPGNIQRFWNSSYRLALGNEFEATSLSDRDWQGAFYYVAIHDEALSPERVRARFRSGSSGVSGVSGVSGGSGSSGRSGARVRDGLVSLYTFSKGSGDRVSDRSGNNGMPDLVIEDPSAVRWLNAGGLRISGPTRIRSEGPADRVTQALTATGETTVEAWVQPANLSQSGPARIVTLSGGALRRNFTLSQRGARLQVRTRTRPNQPNGTPFLESRANGLTSDVQHVAFSFSAATGRRQLYVNGRLVNADRPGGNFSGWEPGYQLALANELQTPLEGRNWQGIYRLVAIYNRALSAEEIRRNFRSGYGDTPPPGNTRPPRRPWDRHGPLQVSSNGRFLEHADGTPFLWFGDTAWNLFPRLTLPEAEEYLTNRKAYGFNIIQAVAIGTGMINGVTDPRHNVSTRQLPFLNLSTLALNDRYFQHVDAVLDRTEALGLYVAFLPTWGDYVCPAWQDGPIIFNTRTARRYGQNLAKRYGKRPNLIWTLGGDRAPNHCGNGDRAVWRAMAEGILDVFQARGWPQPMMAYHDTGVAPRSSRRRRIDGDAWLSIKMFQTHHRPHLIVPATECLYGGGIPYRDASCAQNVFPQVKPVIFSEGTYSQTTSGISQRVVRAQPFWALISGSYAYTFGNSYVWYFDKNDDLLTNPNAHHSGTSWRAQMDGDEERWAASWFRLFSSLEWWNLEPSPEVIIGGRGARENLKVAASSRDQLVVYFPSRTSATLRIPRRFLGSNVNAYWWDPVRDRRRSISALPSDGVFLHPFREDAVLVLDRM